MVKFEVSRTSGWRSDEAPPCPEARLHKVPTPSGRDRAIWTVDIPDIAALLAFRDQYGDLVLTEGFDGLPEIEIYDDYRE